MRLFLPRPPLRLVARTRVIAALEALSKHGIVLVRGAAGAGKTVALLEWANSTQLNGHLLWIGIPPDHVGRRAFWRRILLALEDGGLIPAGLAMIGQRDSEREGSGLLAHVLRAFRLAASPLTFVIDDYHLAQDNTLDRDIAWIVEQSTGTRFVLGLRDGAESTPARLGRAEAAALPSRELAFTELETKQLASDFGLDPSADAVVGLHAMTQGWPLATRLLLQSWADDGAGDQGGAVSPTGEELVRRVLDSRSDVERTFLMATSPATFLTAELADHLHGGDGAAERLDHLANEGIGLWQSERNERVFRYHPLLREGLVKEAKRVSTVAVREGRIRLARWLDERGYGFEAIEQQLAASAWSEMTATVLRHFPTFESEDYGRLLVTLHAIPARALRTQPLLLVARAIGDFGKRKVSPGAARSLLELGLAQLSGTFANITTPEGFVTRAATMILARLTGRDRTALRLARELDEELERPRGTEIDDPGAVIRTYLRVHVGITELFEDDVDAARRNFLGVLEARASGLSWPRMGWGATNLLALAAALSGELADVRHWLSEGRKYELVPGGDGDDYREFGARVAEALLALEEFDYVSAQRILSRLDPAMVSNIENWPYLAHADAVISLLGGASVGALSRSPGTAELAGRRPATSRFLTGLLTANQADLYLAAGQVDRAESLIGGLKDDCPEGTFTRARIELTRGQPERALALTQPHFLSPRPRRRIEALLLGAVAADRIQPGSGAQLASDALVALQESGLRRPLAMVRRDWLTATLAAVAEPDELAQLLDGVPDPYGRVRIVQRLSRSEQRILTELSNEGSALHLAERLNLSTHTVKTHLKNIYRKLGVRSRPEALLVAAELGLLSDSAAD